MVVFGSATGPVVVFGSATGPVVVFGSAGTLDGTSEESILSTHRPCHRSPRGSNLFFTSVLLRPFAQSC